MEHSEHVIVISRMEYRELVEKTTQRDSLAAFIKDNYIYDGKEILAILGEGKKDVSKNN